MNAGVALVRAYLQLNGYFTHSEIPVIREEGKGEYRMVTDIDVLALRFPRAASLVSRGEPGASDDLVLEVDPELGVPSDCMDLIIGEVKEGRPRVNPALRSRETLTTALARLGLTSHRQAESLVKGLQKKGEVRIEAGGRVPCRIRLMAFGGGSPVDRIGYRVFQLRRVARFVRSHLRRYEDVLRAVELADPALGVLHLLEKLKAEGED